MNRAMFLPLSVFAVAHIAMPRSAYADDRPPCFDEATAVKKLTKRDPAFAYPKNARALEHIAAGKRAFGVQQYDKAVEEYTSAGLDDEAPLILYNLGQTYRAAKNYEKAIRQYELFLERGKPGPEVHTLVACHITTMKAELEHAASTAPPSGPAADHVEALTVRRAGSSSVPDDARAHPAVSPPENSERSRWTTTRRIALGAGAAGVVCLAAGVVFGVQTQGFKDDASRLCPTSSCDDPDKASKANVLADRAAKRATLGNISVGVGAGMIIGAAIVWYVGGPPAAGSPSRIDAMIVPHLSPTFASVAYRGRF